jgi:hypothetical protein
MTTDFSWVRVNFVSSDVIDRFQLVPRDTSLCLIVNVVYNIQLYFPAAMVS